METLITTNNEDSIFTRSAEGSLDISTCAAVRAKKSDAPKRSRESFLEDSIMGLKLGKKSYAAIGVCAGVALAIGGLALIGGMGGGSDQ